MLKKRKWEPWFLSNSGRHTKSETVVRSCRQGNRIISPDLRWLSINSHFISESHLFFRNFKPIAHRQVVYSSSRHASHNSRPGYPYYGWSLSRRDFVSSQIIYRTCATCFKLPNSHQIALNSDYYYLLVLYTQCVIKIVKGFLV